MCIPYVVYNIAIKTKNNLFRDIPAEQTVSEQNWRTQDTITPFYMLYEAMAKVGLLQTSTSTYQPPLLHAKKGYAKCEGGEVQDNTSMLARDEFDEYSTCSELRCVSNHLDL